jgi:hypothetical protein
MFDVGKRHRVPGDLQNGLSVRVPHASAVCRLFGPVAADRHAAPAPGWASGRIEEEQRTRRTLTALDQPEIRFADEIGHSSRNRQQ